MDRYTIEGESIKAPSTTNKCDFEINWIICECAVDGCSRRYNDDVSTIIKNKSSSCQKDGGRGEYLGLAISCFRLAKKKYS